MSSRRYLRKLPIIALVMLILSKVSCCPDFYNTPGFFLFHYNEDFYPPFFPGEETQAIFSVDYFYTVDFNSNGWSDIEANELLKDRPDVFQNDLGYFENLTSGSIYGGSAGGYIYMIGRSYCRNKDYPVNQWKNFVKILGNSGNYLWYLKDSKLYMLDLSKRKSMFLSKDVTGLLIRGKLKNFYEKGGNLYVVIVDFATSEEFKNYFYEKLENLEKHPNKFFVNQDKVKFGLKVMTKEDIVYKWLTMMVDKGYYPSELTENGLWGRKLELYSVSNTGMVLQWKYLDRPMSFFRDFNIMLASEEDNMGVSGIEGELTDEVELVILGSRYIILAAKFLTGDGANFVNYFKWLKVNEECRKIFSLSFRSFKSKILKNKVNVKCFNSGYYCNGSFLHKEKHYFHNCIKWDRKIKVPDFSFYKNESDLIGMELETNSDRLMGVYSFFGEGKNAIKFFSLIYPDCFSVSSLKWENRMVYDSSFYSLDSSKKVINLIPFFSGNSIYFQCELSSSTNLVGGLCRYDMDSKELTHLRSDIPPANTVDFPPEEDWDDNKLYVTGDGRYALIVPIHFTKKCLTNDPEKCIYCNRDISPNVWDFGSFSKIYAYSLTDSTRPPVEIDVTGYDGYLVPSPDHMQFAFSMGDKIGILDGKTLEVRVLEVR